MMQQNISNTAGRVLHICVSSKRGVQKTELTSANVLVDYGIEGDAHAGEWHRQVSLLAHVDIEGMRAKGLTLAPGAFGENLVIDGLDTDSLGIGSQLQIGPVLLELTQIGKVCHTRCAIYYKTGDCIMPRTGLFARVLAGGEITSGMPVTVVRSIDRAQLQAAVITISDRCSRGETLDTAGPAAAELLRQELGAHIAWTEIVPDELDQIAKALRTTCERNIDVVITAGGTGLSVRDITPEATRKVIQRDVPGLAEAMRAASARITPNALLSRGVAGIYRQTLIVNLPGSKKAATENLAAILPAVEHAVKMLRNDTAHPESDQGRIISIGQELQLK
jgi:molybdenum cofactor synthesis domain-containing protein